jgi:hypothetical protein
MSTKLKTVLKDVLLVGSVFAVISGSYLGFAVAERYRVLTHAYIIQSERLMEILNAQNTQGGPSAQDQQSDGQ